MWIMKTLIILKYFVYSFIANKCCGEVSIRVNSADIYLGSCSVLFGTINYHLKRQKKIFNFTVFVMTYSIKMNKHYKQSNDQRI